MMYIRDVFYKSATHVTLSIAVVPSFRAHSYMSQRVRPWKYIHKLQTPPRVFAGVVALGVLTKFCAFVWISWVFIPKCFGLFRTIDVAIHARCVFLDQLRRRQTRGVHTSTQHTHTHTHPHIHHLQLRTLLALLALWTKCIFSLT